MKISIFQVVLLAIFGFAALVGLFVFATYSGKSGGSGEVGAVTIWGTLPESAMQSVINSAVQSDTTLKGISYTHKDSATIKNDLAAAIATGSAPDLVLTSQEDLYALSKFITPIPSVILSASTFTSAFVEEGNLFAAPDGYYGVPFLIDPIVLFFNRSILSSEGIAKPPATWEALTGLVPKVAVLSSSRQISRGLIALGTYPNVHNARGILSVLFLQAGVPISSITNNIISANLGKDSSVGNSGKAAVGFYTQFADPSKISYTWNASLEDSQQKFLKGDLALYLGYASEARYFAAANPNLNFLVAPVPQPATAATKVTYGLLYAFMIPRGAKNPAGAFQAAAAFTNPALQTSAAGATGFAPVALSQLSSAPSNVVAAVAYASALYAKGWLSPLPADTDAVFSSMIQSVVSGRLNLDSALVSAGRSLNALLQQ